MTIALPRLISALRLFMVLIWAIFTMPLQAQNFLPAEEAFQFSTEVVDQQAIAVVFKIEPGYYLYRDRFAFTAQPDLLGKPEIPPGKIKFDENFGKEVETYRDQLRIVVPLTGKTNTLELTVTSQGCADAGLCYPPQKQTVSVDLSQSPASGSAASPTQSSTNDAARASISPSASTMTPNSEDNRITQALHSGSLSLIVPVFFVLGLLLCFTPCVLPMLPILSSIIVGSQTDGQAPSRTRNFMLSLLYSLGMALVYTALGVAAGLIGEGLSAALQKPWVLVLFAALLVALALSMFGWYELQLPMALRDKLSGQSEKQSGGSLTGVFIMGALSALIVSPCVAAPLAGALLYISQTRNVLVGGSALFAMAIGMSVPLLLIGLSAGSLLPRAGNWMNKVKAIFGVLLLLVAIWVVSPVLPEAWRPFSRIVDAFNPQQKVQFQRVKSSTELDAALAQAKAEGKMVVFDFYADWCVSCIEMEKLTFPHPSVKPLLEQMVRLQVDVTANSEADKALLKRFNLFGPPGIIFFNAQGDEVTAARVIGFMPAETFAKRLQQLQPNSGTP